MTGGKDGTVRDLETSKLSDDGEEISPHSPPIELNPCGYRRVSVRTEVKRDAPKLVGQLRCDRSPHAAAEAGCVTKHEQRRVCARWTTKVVNRDLNAVGRRDELGDRAQEDES